MHATANTDEVEPIDWFYQFSYPIAGESLTKVGLRKRRKAIENIVAPYVTQEKTRDAIRFAGKVRYVKRIEAKAERKNVWYAIESLQAIYHLQDAWRERDINDVVRLAYNVGLLDMELLKSEFFKCEIYTELNAWFQTKKRGNSKKGKTKLKSNQDLLLQTAYANNRKKRNWLQAMTTELRVRHGFKVLSTRTVSRRLKELGIVDK